MGALQVALKSLAGVVVERRPDAAGLRTCRVDNRLYLGLTDSGQAEASGIQIHIEAHHQSRPILDAAETPERGGRSWAAKPLVAAP